MESTNCVPVSTHTSGVSGDDGFITNSTLAQDYVPGNALVTNSNLGYAPMVLGEANWADEPSVVGLGDSILYGQGPRAAGASGDDDFGNWSWLEKMLFANSIPYWGMARGSAQATTLWNGGSHRMAKRLALLQQIGHKPMLIEALGRNDLGSSIHLSSTNSLHALLRPYMRKIVKSTVVPWTTPNPFPAGGTGQADASSGNVAAWNALVRGLTSFPEVDGSLDVNAVISGLYTGGSEALWDVSGGDPTSDATHPNALGDNLMSSRILTATDDFADLLADVGWPGY
jgi:lysophospholipase L1-like esterase